MSRRAERFSVFVDAVTDFHATRDRLGYEVAGLPGPEAIQATKDAAGLVLLSAMPYEEATAAADELGVATVFPSEAEYQATLDDAGFAFDPKGYLRKFGSYSTEIAGKRMTFYLLGEEFIVHGDEKTIEQFAGAHARPIPGGIQ